MTPFQEQLVVAAGAAVGGALLVLAVLVAVRRARGGSSAGASGSGDLRRMGRRIRQLERIARRTEERLNSRMDELRGLLARADRFAATHEGLYVAEPPQDPAQSAPPPAMLEKQRDHILRLKFQGLEPIDIARRTRLPVGEVELTLKLHKGEQEQARRGAENP